MNVLRKKNQTVNVLIHVGEISRTVPSHFAICIYVVSQYIHKHICTLSFIDTQIEFVMCSHIFFYHNLFIVKLTYLICDQVRPSVGKYYSREIDLERKPELQDSCVFSFTVWLSLLSVLVLSASCQQCSQPRLFLLSYSLIKTLESLLSVLLNAFFPLSFFF